MVLIMFASPLASLVRLGFLLYQYFIGVEVDSTRGTSAGITKDLSTITNSTIEDIVEAILSSHFTFPSNPKHGITYSSMADIVNSPTLKMLAVHHDLPKVLPWFFIMFFFCSITFLMLIVNRAHMAQHFSIYPGEIAESEHRMRRFAKKVRRLITCLENYQSELAAEDFIQSREQNYGGNSECGAETKAQERKISIPKPGESNLSESKHETNDTCAICLSNYVQGQQVVWSSNQECVHVFHHGCVVQWIKKRASADCVCCRRAFVDKEIYANIKMKMKVE